MDSERGTHKPDASAQVVHPDPLGADAVLDALPEAVLLVDGRRIVRANAAARQTWSPHLVGRSLVEVLVDGEIERFELLDRQRRDGWPLPSTCRMRFRKDSGGAIAGDVRWVHLPDGRMLLSIRDVTDATRAEEIMARLAHLSGWMDGPDSLFDAAAPVFLELGWTVAFTELVEGGSITRRILSKPGDPIGAYGRTLLDKFMPRDKTPILSEAVRRDQPIFLDNLPATQNGAPRRATAMTESMERARVVRSVWCPIKVGNETTHFLAVTGRDITEHDFVAVQMLAAQVGASIRLSALHRELVQRERLAAVGEMAAVLAHEVRNPLSVMFNALSSLGREIPLDTRQELVKILREEAHHLQQLVSDLLEFAQPAIVEPKPVDLRAIFDEVVAAAECDPSCTPAHPRWVVDVAPDLRAVTDAARLRRALLNLVVNALQHMTPGGRLAVTARRAESGEIVLRVENDGAIIPSDVAPRIFDPFFTTKSSGTGLGLAIVRRVCADLGGRVALRQEASGPAFEIVLPRAASLG